AAVGGQALVPVVEAAAEVEARTERAARAPQEDDLGVAVADRLGDRRLELFGHRRDDRVQPLRAVEGDRGDRAVGGVGQRLVGHAREYLALARFAASRSQPYSMASKENGPAWRSHSPERRRAK